MSNKVDFGADDFLALIRTPDLPALGPEVRDSRQPAEKLERAVGAFCESRGVEGEARDCLRSSALLWHDHLDLSHQISQGISSATGSFLHGIMHRREPDFGNAAYWFRRVGPHPAFSPIATGAAAYLAGVSEEALAARLTPKGVWDPFAFIDACEAVSNHRAIDQETRLRELQRIEFEALIRWLGGSL